LIRPVCPHDIYVVGSESHFTDDLRLVHHDVTKLTMSRSQRKAAAYVEIIAYGIVQRYLTCGSAE
jgi:hypothetical protein